MSLRATQTNNSQFKAIDFFCGGGGMTCGLRQAGIDVIAGVDFDEYQSRVNKSAFRKGVNALCLCCANVRNIY